MPPLLRFPGKVILFVADFNPNCGGVIEEKMKCAGP
jgi:hypothetical protein